MAKLNGPEARSALRAAPVVAGLVAVAGCVIAAAPVATTPDRAVWRSGTYERCLTSAHGMRPIEHCTAGEIDRQRAALERRSAKLLNGLSGQSRDKFIADQSAWDAGMEARCTVFSRRRGSLNSMKAQDCFLAEIVKRRSALGDGARLPRDAARAIHETKKRLTISVSGSAAATAAGRRTARR
jgi:uncharacterized protein YecT (DUF1311 family)